MTHNFQLVVNEFENAPANTQDIDVAVTVVIDNAPPDVHEFAPASGSVDERAERRHANRDLQRKRRKQSGTLVLHTAGYGGNRFLGHRSIGRLYWRAEARQSDG